MAMTANQLRTLLLYGWECDPPVATVLLGAPATGKSSVVRQTAREWITGVRAGESSVGGFSDVPWWISFPALDRDPTDVRGLLIPDGNGGATWTTPDILELMQEAEKGVLCIEELPQALDAMQCVLRPALLERTIGGHRIPDGWRVVATGNRPQDHAGAGTLLAHLATSVVLIDDFRPAAHEWLAWAERREIAPLVRQYLRDNADALFPPTGPLGGGRSWEVFATFAGAPARTFNVAADTILGEAPAASFRRWCVSRMSVTPTEIMADPDHAHVESGPIGVQVVRNLAEYVERHQLGRAVVYMARVPREHGAVLCRSLLEKFGAARELVRFAKSFHMWKGLDELDDDEDFDEDGEDVV